MNIEGYEQLKIENQLCFPLYAASRKITGLYTPLLKKYDLTYTQYIAMLILWEYGEMTVGELCTRMMLDNGTVSPLLSKLEAKGYVRREKNRDDERVVKIIVEDKGEELKEKVKDVPFAIGSCFKLEDNEAVTLYKLLYSILAE